MFIQLTGSDSQSDSSLGCWSWATAADGGICDAVALYSSAFRGVAGELASSVNSAFRS
jgi:hypothetical protein